MSNLYRNRPLQTQLTVDGLIDSVDFTLPVWDAAQTGTWQQPQASRDYARLVADDVPEQITRYNNAVQCSWILDHDHRRAVDQLMPQLQLRKLLCYHLAHHLPPQPTRRKHVGLV